MKPRLAGLLLAFICPTLFAAQPATWGWVEQARLMPENALLKVRLDTGVQTSVMDARNLVKIRKNEQRWVHEAALVGSAERGEDC